MNSKSVEYQYHNAPVPGGGFVTGFLFHPLAKGILYARTDIGGVYRYDFAKRNWKSLIDHVTHLGKWETNPLSIALDRDDPETLYIVAGDNREKSFLCISPDRGESFSYLPIPGPVHGNAPGRGTGERLQADPYEKNLLYFGSMSRGLLRSEDRGKSWEPLRIRAPGGKEELNIAFVWLDEGSGKTGQRCRTLVVATDGSGNADARNRRAPGLYISYDAGASFAPMPGQPAPPARGNYPGFVGQRAAFENGFLYITLASVLNSWRGFAGYGCDMGGAQYGKVLRYTLDPENRTLSGWQDISPDAGLDCGFGGICADLK
ncbi:MAG: hypothetical protein LBT39_05940, partial [Treponema sp.]|nr:hypothetical protein [Treponema sp.]